MLVLVFDANPLVGRGVAVRPVSSEQLRRRVCLGEYAMRWKGVLVQRRQRSKVACKVLCASCTGRPDGQVWREQRESLDQTLKDRVEQRVDG